MAPEQGPAQQRIRVGILGCSDIARRRFLPALLKTKNAVLSVVASRDLEKAKRFCPSAAYDIAGYDGLLARDNVDLVYISLPNHLHEEWVMKALEQGKHVICEKPLAPSSEAVKRMTGYAEVKGLLLYENIVYLHHPRHQAVKNMIAAGTIGVITELRTSFGFMLKDCGGFRMKTGQGGGAFLDQARYPLSAALFFLTGAAYRFDGRALFRNGLNVAMRVNARTDCDEHFTFSIGFEQDYECWYELVGERGTLRVDRAYTAPADLAGAIQLMTNGDVASAPVPAADHFALMLEKVCDLILRKQDYSGLCRDARRLALLADQAWESCERVNLGEMRNEQP